MSLATIQKARYSTISRIGTRCMTARLRIVPGGERGYTSIRTEAQSVMSRMSSKWMDAKPAQRRRWGLSTSVGVLALLVGGMVVFSDDDPILNRPNPADRRALSETPTSKLIKGWIVYAFCSSPTLIVASETMFNFVHTIPILSWPVDYLARITFFHQFFAGETAEESEKKVWIPLRRAAIGALAGYNIEAKHDGTGEPQHIIDQQVEETLNSIRAVGLFGIKNSAPADVAGGDTRCWIRTKLTGLTTDPEVVVRASKAITSQRRDDPVIFPGAPMEGDWTAMLNNVTDQDRTLLTGLYQTLRQIMEEGQKFGVRVIIDAEQTWYQPAIDVYTEELMREFNSGQGPPIVCASFQAYLRRNPDMIRSQMERARLGGYKLIFKQIRGAYHPYEITRWKELGNPGLPPVWTTKSDTDKSYNTGINLGLDAVKARMDDDSRPDVAFICATHNEHSFDVAMEGINRLGLGSRQADGSTVISGFAANRIAFAQIFGMKDNLTNRIAGSLRSETGLPLVCKSVSYGSFEDGLPYLSRRAVENKTVMEGRGGASTERKRLARELCRRWIPFYSK